MRLLTLLMLLATACMADKQEDTSVETDTDTDPPVDADFTFAISDAENKKVGLVLVLTDEEGGEDEGSSFGDSTVVSEAISAGDQNLTVVMGVPDASTLTPLEENPSVQIGMWAPFLFDDADDGDFDEGEAISGFGMTWLIYSTTDVAEFGVVNGWNALQMNFDSDPVVADINAVPLTSNISHNESVTFGGSFDSSMGADRRIALVPSQYFDDKTVRSLVDQSLTDPWSVTLYGAPPADHFMPPENGFTTAGEVALVYQDDGNQTLDMSDLMWGINTICSDLGPVTMLYVPGPTDFSSAMMSVGVGMPSGWNIITTSGEEEEMNLLTETEFQSLEIDDDCTFED